ncbi:large conductance mechanosensitive channel protein MscL [Candidatus Peregrinibacteria bacterium CG11_big_fil_rev_8_21_14_0_20_41_10]|nr:MAG: large conductance mechanosensitive channel protein MscL [Candidatus Peregrinibacteria bacterium CG11_big_fil_rev_8_21_14_0_20_41_10]
MLKVPTQKAKDFWSSFRDFAFKGNMIDLAVGIVIGTGFNNIVKSLVDNIIMPTIGNLIGNVDFSELYINLNGHTYTTLAEADASGAPIIKYGLFLTQLLDFIILALTLFVVLKILFRYLPKVKPKA